MGSLESRQEFSLLGGLKRIYALMTPRLRRDLVGVILLMLAGAVAELATIGAVIPYLIVLADSGGARARPFISLAQRAGLGADPVVLATIAFILIAVAAGIVRLQLARSSRRFIFALGHMLSLEIQRRVLLQPYSFHVHRNSSTLLSALDKMETLLFEVLLPLMQAVTGAIIGMFVLALLLSVAPVTTLLVTAAFAASYLLISAITRKRLKANSKALETAFDERLKIVQESLGGIRDVIIDNAQPLYLRRFDKVDARLSSARTGTQLIALAPRYLIETGGIVIIALIALAAANRSGGISAALPVVGALALGAQRLLPLVQGVYSGWSTVEGERSVFAQVIELLSLPVADQSTLPEQPFALHRALTLKDVSFTYPTRRQAAIDGVSLSIPRGTMLALVGPTGSGKSTLVDLIMALLPADCGEIALDDLCLTPANRQLWYRSIAHVPQSIFLADSTIAENIALSLPDSPIDHDRIIDSATKAQLHGFIASLPEGYDTYVGERGVRLSGGQRQRLGIARAIYKDAPIIILDEATSALDDLTERAVVEALEGLRCEGRTILIVAHRQSTIRQCDLIARLDHGRLVEVAPHGKNLRRLGRSSRS
jgi:ABC-type multidrug transport system fused ATPase/permease subunit